MKTLIKTLNSVIVLFGILLIASCGGSDPKPIDETQRVKGMLTISTWNMSKVTVNGSDQTNVYDGLKLTFNSTSVTAINGEPVWPASETWSFVDNTAKVITRGDGLVVNIIYISETELKLELTWNQTTIGSGRTLSISGKHLFILHH